MKKFARFLAWLLGVLIFYLLVVQGAFVDSQDSGEMQGTGYHEAVSRCAWGGERVNFEPEYAVKQLWWEETEQRSVWKFVITDGEYAEKIDARCASMDDAYDVINKVLRQAALAAEICGVRPELEAVDDEEARAFDPRAVYVVTITSSPPCDLFGLPQEGA